MNEAQTQPQPTLEHLKKVAIEKLIQKLGGEVPKPASTPTLTEK